MPTPILEDSIDLNTIKQYMSCLKFLQSVMPLILKLYSYGFYFIFGK